MDPLHRVNIANTHNRIVIFYHNYKYIETLSKFRFLYMPYKCKKYIKTFITDRYLCHCNPTENYIAFTFCSETSEIITIQIPTNRFILNLKKCNKKQVHMYCQMLSLVKPTFVKEFNKKKNNYFVVLKKNNHHNISNQEKKKNYKTIL